MTVRRQAAGSEAPLSFEDAREVEERFYDNRWTDGLPMVTPTVERVEEMLKSVSRDADEPLGRMPPRWRPTSVHHVAVNAVMAGCRPEYFPTVVAAIEACLDDEFNLYGIQGTTNPAGVMVLVNGPARHTLDVNSGFNVFGQGWRSNATIGRAVRLCLINIGGGLPELGDMSTLGNPNKFGSCIAENEEESPWEPFHVERGYDADRSVVTVAGVTGPQNVCIMSQDAEAILDGIADSMMPAGSNLMMFTAEPLVAIGPVHARHLARDGFGKAQIRDYLWDRGTVELASLPATDRKTVLRWKEPCVVVRDGREYVRPAVDPSAIGIVVAGGRSGPHSAVLQPFNATQLVSRPVEDPA